jgi:hypothetical protein
MIKNRENSLHFIFQNDPLKNPLKSWKWKFIFILYDFLVRIL